LMMKLLQVERFCQQHSYWLRKWVFPGKGYYPG